MAVAGWGAVPTGRTQAASRIKVLPRAWEKLSGVRETEAEAKAEEALAEADSAGVTVATAVGVTMATAVGVTGAPALGDLAEEAEERVAQAPPRAAAARWRVGSCKRRIFTPIARLHARANTSAAIRSTREPPNGGR